MKAGLRAISLALGLCAMAPAQAEVSYKIADFGDLQGWAQDDHAAALAVFRKPAPIWMTQIGKACARFLPISMMPVRFFSCFFALS